MKDTRDLKDFDDTRCRARAKSVNFWSDTDQSTGVRQKKEFAPCSSHSGSHPATTEWMQLVLPASQDQNLALTVLYVPDSLNSGPMQRWPASGGGARFHRGECSIRTLCVHRRLAQLAFVLKGDLQFTVRCSILGRVFKKPLYSGKPLPPTKYTVQIRDYHCYYHYYRGTSLIKYMLPT